MYANYLIDVGKLVYIIGDTQNTTQFKNLFQAGTSNKQSLKKINQDKKYFTNAQNKSRQILFKNKNSKATKKVQSRKNGLQKSQVKQYVQQKQNPEMIVMIFNCTPQLQENEVWQDRLKIILKKINKVYDMMKTNNKQEVRLRIIILISKHTFGGINLHEKVTNFLKNYEKDLFIIQIQFYAKELAKIRNQWVYALQKNYDNKYKKIQKRYEESFLQRKLGCMVKMAILSQMLTKRDQKDKYIETYKALRYRFSDAIKTVGILTHNQIRELRAVSDVIFLRYLKVLIRSNISPEVIFRQTLDHMNYFKLKNLDIHQTHKYFYYEQLLWRCTFIENFFEILYSNDLMENLNPLSLCELLNQLITYLHALSIVSDNLINQEKNLGANQIQQQQENYIGLISYKTQQLFQTDLIYSFMKDLLSHRKDFLSKGIQLITRYKTMNLFRKNQLLFLNVYLLRLYFQDNKFQGFLNIYDQIMKQQISRSNYFLLNEIFNQIKEDFNNITQEQKVMFYGVSCLICDYFENTTELQNHLDHLIKSVKSEIQTGKHKKSIDLLGEQQVKKQEVKNQTQLNQDYKFHLKKNSHIVAVECYIEEQFVYIENQIKIKILLNLNSILRQNGCELEFIFNENNIKKRIKIPAGSESQSEHVIAINSLDYFTKDQILRIQCVKIYTIPNLVFLISKNHISFVKHRQNKIYSNIRCPDIQIYNPYAVYYINQVAKFEINIQKLDNFNVQAKCSIKQQDVYGKTEVFVDFDERINLTNSNYYQQLVSKDKVINQFWLKCNKLGEKSLKLTFHFTIQKMINKSQDLLNDFTQNGQGNRKSYVLKQHFNITKEIKFQIIDLFKITKTFYQLANDDSKILENKNVPVDKKIITVLQLQSVQDVQIKQIGQHKNPKKIQYFKEINKKNFLLKKGNKVKLNMIFKIPPQYNDEIQLFLMSVYLKWTRIQAKVFTQPYQNLFLDYETKVNCFLNPLSINLNVANHFSVIKNKPSRLSISIKSHSQSKTHIFIQVQGTSSILRIGQRQKQTYLNPKDQNYLQFDILPVTSGYLSIPNIRVFVDGKQRKMNIGSGQMIKCI